MSAPIDIVDERRQPIRLTKMLGRGGEGSVYEVDADPTLAAKIYVPDKALARREKILAMAHAKLYEATAGVAYPIGPLFNTKGLFAGFTMQKVGKRRPIHELYSPSSRRNQFPKADFRFLLRTTLNVANSVALVHRSGCVIGDINHSGILISQDATASLIDADSFQFHFGGQTFRCAVGVPDFTPPELQGGRLDRTDRTENHDAFGLAVIIFQILFMGRHPFVGGYLGGGEMPMEKAIEQCRFAYSSDQTRTKMEAPPHVPLLADIPPELASAFENAFSPTTKSGGRPTAADWSQLLRRAETELIRCKTQPAHHHFRNAGNCPWCRMERGFPGFLAFSGTVQVNTAAPADLSQLIAAIRAVPDLSNAPPLAAAMPLIQVTPKSPPKQNKGAAGFVVATLGALSFIPLGTTQLIHPFLAFVGFGGCAYTALRRSPAAAPQRQSEILRKGFAQHEEHYRAVSESRRFAENRQRSETEIRELSNLANEENRQIAELSRKLKDLQLRRFLEKYQIASAKIKGVGNSKKATLRSYGIETAADVDKYAIERISGFGPTTSALLIAWRQFHEKKFIFNPNQPINPADVARVKQQIAQERLRLEQLLRTRLSDLRHAHAEIQQARGTSISHATNIWRDLKQAEADESVGAQIGNPANRLWSFVTLSVLTFIVSLNVSSDRAISPSSNVLSPAPQVRQQTPAAQFKQPGASPSPQPQNRPSANTRASQTPSEPTTSPAATPRQTSRYDSNVPSTYAPPTWPSPLTQPASPQVTPTSPPPLGAPQEVAKSTVTPDDSTDAPVMEKLDQISVGRRLGALGYLLHDQDVSVALIRQAVQEFKIVNGLGSSDDLDAPTARALTGSAAIAKGQSFIGGWSPIETCTQGAQLEVTILQARTDAGVCRFGRVTSDSTGWKVQARCQVGAQSWPANISLNVVGRRMEWRSEKGREIYYRCR